MVLTTLLPQTAGSIPGNNVMFQTNLKGESGAVPQATVHNWTKRLVDITQGYDLQNIFNVDETGLFFRALPQGSMVLKDDPRKGIKTAKDGITILLTCSATWLLENLKTLGASKA